MSAILDFFDAAVTAGTLTSVHPPSGNQKLDAFRVLLINENFEDALQKCDGKTNPSDFVEGSAREELHSMIQSILSEIYPYFKQIGQMV